MITSIVDQSNDGREDTESDMIKCMSICDKLSGGGVLSEGGYNRDNHDLQPGHRFITR